MLQKEGAMARRTYKNTSIPLPTGEVMKLGVHVANDGSLSVKLRLPSDYWSLNWLSRAAQGTRYENGKTVVVLDRAV